MPGLIHDLRVFIATPSGLAPERRAFRDILREHNDLDPQGRRVLFTPIGWEDTLGGVGRPQALINEELVNCDYFVLVLWDRWGSPTDPAKPESSGIEEEFALALECLADPDRPMRQVMVVFKEVEERRLQDPGEQLRRVIAFRRDLEASKKHFYVTFSEIESFRSFLRRCLMTWTRDTNSTFQEHLDVLKQGVLAWNQWRHVHPTITPRLADSDLRGLYLDGVDLHNADLRRADLSEAVLTGATLHSANLAAAKLVRTNLHRADLRATNLSEAILVSTHLNETRFEGAVFHKTICASLNLSAALALDKISHPGPSDIDINTILRSKGQIPDSFIFHCGVNPLIQSLLVGTRMSMTDAFYEWVNENSAPLRLQSCFISYSLHDKPFVDRLRRALHASGVNYWYAPEHAQTGKVLTSQIDREIELRDRVILVCSEHSLSSDWVRWEIDRTREQERARGKSILFPIMLDDTVLGWDDPRASRIRELLVGDFRGATKGKAFEERFGRLMEGLRDER